MTDKMMFQKVNIGDKVAVLYITKNGFSIQTRTVETVASNLIVATRRTFSRRDGLNPGLANPGTRRAFPISRRSLSIDEPIDVNRAFVGLLAYGYIQSGEADLISLFTQIGQSAQDYELGEDQPDLDKKTLAKLTLSQLQMLYLLALTTEQ